MPADQHQSSTPVSSGMAGELEVPIPIDKSWKDTASFYLHFLFVFMPGAGLLVWVIGYIRQNGWSVAMGSILVVMTVCTVVGLLMLVFQLWRREAETCWLTEDELVWDIGFARTRVPLLWISRCEPVQDRPIPQSFFHQRWAIISLIQRPQWNHAHILSWFLRLVPSTLPGHFRSPRFGNALVILPLNMEHLFNEIAARAPQLSRERNVLTADPVEP